MITIKIIIEFLYGLYQKYGTKNEAFDEILEDPRDYEMLGSAYISNMPDVFYFEPRQYINQNVPGYQMSCVAQGTAEASNTIRKIKADKTNNSGFTLFDIMVDKKLANRSLGAYLIDGIKEGYSLGYFSLYFRIRTITQLENVIYENTNLIVTGSSKIDWNRLKTTNYIVDRVGTGYGHAFYVLGFDKKKQLVVCANSYGPEWGDKGKFYIPYNLFFEVCFNSTYAISVDPEWTKLTRDELFERFSILKK